MTGVAELIQHIKANPSGLDAAVLAKQFQVDASVVQSALKRVSPQEARVDQKSFHKRLGESLVRLWIKVTSRPVLFLAVTSLLALALLKSFSFMPESTLQSLGKHTAARLYGGILIGIPLLHFLAMAQFAKFRYVFIGGGIYLVAIVSLLASSGQAEKPTFWLTVVSMFALSILYLVVGAPFVIFGSFRKVQKQKRAYESMTRQQLLERLLWVRQTLSAVTEKPVTSRPFIERFFATAEKYLFFVTTPIAFATSSVMSLAMLSVDPNRTVLRSAGQISSDPRTQSTLLILTMGMSLVIYASQFVIGACNRTIGKLLVCLLLYGLGYVIAAMMPFSYIAFGDHGSVGWGNYLFGVLLQCAMLTVGYLGRVVYEHTIADERRRNNDPAALTDELVELEWRLTPTSSRVTVLAVDVAGSTSMKRTADPLVAEWSFREYQTWIETTCAQFGGKVHSTAGDGAIVGFENPESALQASVAIFANLSEFNETKNKLGDAFQLRIGLHIGDVQGNLGDVQFTRVIDVAAHIESKAPIGGIAASEVLVEALGPDNFQKLAVTTDGHDVYAYRDPGVSPELA